MALSLLSVVVMTTLFPMVVSFSKFKAAIPNGDRVPNPCDTSSVWNGVGHRSTMGAGPLNPFGNDFRLNDKVWNRTICQQDSDGDGYSNGFELGDPDCTWSAAAGQPPARTTQLSHPGICDPVDSAECTKKNSWLGNCNSTKFDCPAINDPNVKNYTMRFPTTTIPAEETIYMCYKFEIPNNSTSDIIAIEPYLDNTKVIHHMLLFGCTDQSVGVPDGKPYRCGMGQGSCSSLIGLWGPGILGQCLSNQLGFRIGPGALRTFMIQTHWNNPMQEANLTDSSGMRVYYTPQLRRERGEIMMLGQNSLEIPPGKDSVTFYGRCSASCTRRFSQPMNITASVLHMHLLGVSGSIVLHRKDHTKLDLEIVEKYDYNSPTIKEYETPITVMPGDYIGVTCVYNSTGRDRTTSWGEGTMDEMCYAFLTYYPQMKGETFCGQWKSVDICGNGGMFHDACNLTLFLHYVSLVISDCATSCTASSCADTLKRAMNTGCQRNLDVRAFLLAFFPTQGYVMAYCAFDQPSVTGVSNRCPRGQDLSYASLLLLLVFVVTARRLAAGVV